MATYAAVVSVLHLTNQIQAYHAQHSIFSHKQQRQLESLSEKVRFLHDFLESYSYDGSDEAETLESRILDAAYTAEDLIEHYVVDDIHLRKRENENKKNDSKINLRESTSGIKMEATKFYQDVGKIIKSIDSIKREILGIKDKSKVGNGPHPNEPEQAGLLGGLLNIEKDTVVGFDDISNSIMEKLAVKQPNLQVITITGMGGSGKSTLAKKVYDDRSVKQNFDVCGWVTLSPEFNIEKVLLRLLSETGFHMHQIGNQNFDYNKLGELLHKHLSGRRFFVVIDDIWSVQAWDRIKLFLQDSNKGSRILVTTRLVDLASNVGSRHTFKMELLDDTQSWNLLCKSVFGQEKCPPELEEVGNIVAKNCKGLPLSLVVIGGLLKKSIKREFWESIVEDTNASVNSEDNERCLKILYMSYNHMPIHLKPCFLYLGVFPEDHEIRVSELIKLWVAERFLTPIMTKSLEEVAIKNVKDLISRNLIFVTELGTTGNVKHCKVHDLLRDMCLREATKRRFLYIANALKQGRSNHRRLVLCGGKPYGEHSPHRDLVTSSKSSSYLRSFICDFQSPLPTMYPLKLVSVLKLPNCHAKVRISNLVNSRYLSVSLDYDPSDLFKGLVYHLWNLQTLILSCKGISSTFNIWAMPQLRHAIINGFVVRPCDDEDNTVLKKFQTLKGTWNFRCSKGVVQNLPNLKTLSVSYNDFNLRPEFLKNLGRFRKLESLRCFSGRPRNISLSSLRFPLSLKKLSLKVFAWNWGYIGEKVGSLPHLEMFKLCYFEEGEEWNSVEGRFPCLKYLFICARNLVQWTADSSCFPCLEHLRLSEMEKLEEIPSEIGDIPTLRLIEVSCDSSASAIDSAKMILNEQRGLCNEELTVTVDGRFYGAQSLSIFKTTVTN